MSTLQQVKKNKNRYIFFLLELRLKCFKYLLYSSNLRNVFYKEIQFLLSFYFTYAYLNYNFLNFCLLTGQHRSVQRRFALSRHKVKQLGAFNLLLGFTKSSW